MPSSTSKRRSPAASIATNPARPAKKVVAKPAPTRRAAPKPVVAAAPAKKLLKPMKAPSATKPPKAAKAPGAAKPIKVKRRLVRDSFTMPATDYDLINILKDRALTFMRPAKKSELLRAGLHALAALPEAQLKSQLDALMPLKPGRPKKVG